MKETAIVLLTIALGSVAAMRLNPTYEIERERAAMQAEIDHATRGVEFSMTSYLQQHWKPSGEVGARSDAAAIETPPE